jgi:hypothetical protein
MNPLKFPPLALCIVAFANASVAKRFNGDYLSQEAGDSLVKDRASELAREAMVRSDRKYTSDEKHMDFHFSDGSFLRVPEKGGLAVCLPQAESKEALSAMLLMSRCDDLLERMAHGEDVHEQVKELASQTLELIRRRPSPLRGFVHD